MANAKQINELNDASSVSASTKLAVAQPNGTEAESATVSVLADTISDVLNTGALAELTYATSQGKNAIATALTNKGVETTASETLIQMADKVNNLSVDTNSDKIINQLPTKVGTTTNLPTAGLSPFSACLMNDGYTAVQSKSVIYLFKSVGEYESLQDAISKAEMSINMQTPNANSNYAYMTRSQDGKTLVTYSFDSAGTVDIYDINYATKEISYVKSITGITNYRNQIHFAISNDRKLIAYYANWSSDSRLALVDDISVYASLNMNMSRSSSFFAFDEENTNTLYALAHYESKLYTVDFVASDSSITINTSTFISTTPIGNESEYYVDKERLLVFYGAAQDSVTIQADVYNKTLKVLDLRAQEKPAAEISYIVISDAIDASYITSVTISYVQPTGFGTTHPIIDGNVLTYNLSFPRISVAYDRANHSLQIVGTDKAMYFNGCSQPQSAGWGYAMIILYTNSNLSEFCMTYNAEMLDSGSSYYVGYATNISYTAQDKFIGYIRTINEKKVYFVRRAYTSADIAAGIYDVNSEIIPAVPDEE